MPAGVRVRLENGDFHITAKLIQEAPVINADRIFNNDLAPGVCRHQ
jgi:hypothetical protein